MNLEISDIIQEVINAITQLHPSEDYLKEFALLEKNYEKVAYVEHFITQMNKIEEISENHILRFPKDDEMSIELHGLANTKYAEKHYSEALELFNESICFAEPGSWNLAMSYANRSLILHDLERWRPCLDSIELARKAMPNMPPAVAERLKQRESSARINFKKFGELQPYPFRLSYEQHKNISYAANTLMYSEQDEWGRHVRAKIAMPPGKLLAIEDPFVSMLQKSERYTRCANCLLENFLSLIPCPDCTSVMFCSEHCLNEGTLMFHQYECPVIDLFQKIFFKTHIVAMRMVFKGLHIMGSMNEVMNFCCVPGNLNQSIFTVDLQNNPSHGLYQAVHGLVTHQKERSVKSFFYYATLCSLVRRFLFDFTDFDMVCYDDEKRTFFSDLLFHYLQISNCNASDIHVSQLRNNYREGDVYGTGMYSLRSMFNHSCAPNVMTVFKGSKLFLYTIRPIAANAQLFVSYDTHYTKKEKIYRQTYLFAKYYFDCNCEACKNDYPLFFDLKRRFYVRSTL